MAHDERPHRAQPQWLHVQLWRLSDLKLLKTVALPPVASGAHLQPAEPRRLSNGEVLLATMRCGLFRITGFDVDTFDARLVHQFGAKGACAVPVVVGNFWVQPVAPAKLVVALDVTDPAKPREVSKVQPNDRQWPHWLAHDAEGNRIVVVNSGAGEARIWMLTIDPKTGTLELDETFRDPGSSAPGVSFDRVEWPHGTTGPAIPHGSVFGN